MSYTIRIYYDCEILGKGNMIFDAWKFLKSTDLQ